MSGIWGAIVIECLRLILYGDKIIEKNSPWEYRSKSLCGTVHMISCWIKLQILSVTEVRQVSDTISAIDGAYSYLPLYFQKIDGAYSFLPTLISGTAKDFWALIYGHLLAVGIHVH